MNGHGHGDGAGAGTIKKLADGSCRAGVVLLAAGRLGIVPAAASLFLLCSLHTS